ncbi:MAG: polysaccharide deacetylase family protein [Oscillospiraceae bacterium]|nr:polysaccharide deacetylase family protein [Oscillospiraceae bacterium]
MWKQRLLFLLFAVLVLLGCVSGETAVPADGIADIPAETNYIALTFDDGPRKGTTDRLLDGLKERGASATFFLVGEQAQANPELVRRMKAEGHQIGNHTWSHVRLEGAAPAVVTEEVGKNEAFLAELLGEGSYWLRPPYGLITPGTESQIAVPMVKWSVDPRDWESRDTAKVVQAVLKDAKPNSIILLHDIYPTSVDAALQIVDTLQSEGYLFVTVEELLCLNGVTPQAGIMYRTGTGT